MILICGLKQARFLSSSRHYFWALEDRLLFCVICETIHLSLPISGPRRKEVWGITVSRWRVWINEHFQPTGGSIQRAELGCQVSVLVFLQFTCCAMLGKFFTLFGSVCSSAKSDKLMSTSHSVWGLNGSANVKCLEPCKLYINVCCYYFVIGEGSGIFILF